MEGQVAQLQSALEEARASSTRQAIEAESALHDLQSQLSHVEQRLAEERLKSSQAAEVTEKEKHKVLELLGEKEKVESERRAEKVLVEEAKKKCKEVEREKRELLAVVEREVEEKNSLDESLSSLRKLHNSLQSSHSTLESSLQETTTSLRTSILRIQTLSSSVTSLEADKQFLTTELNRGREEWSTSRRESHSTLTRVQSELEQSQIELSDTKTSLAAIKIAHETLGRRHEETLEQLCKVREERDSNEGSFVGEMGSMRRLVDMLEKREEGRKKRLDEIERDLEEERKAALAREEELNDVIRRERERCDELEVRCAELREAVEVSASNGGGPGGADGEGMMSPYGARSSSNDSFALSPSAMLAVRGQKSGRSYAEIYGEYVRMQDELARERAETRRLGECLSQILSDIEERAPLLKEQRQEYDRLSIEATEIATQLGQAISDREAAERRAEGYRLDLDLLRRDQTIQTQQLRDLGRQVRSLLRKIAASEFSHLSSTAPDSFDEEESEIQRRVQEDSTTDAVVSAHLVTFRSINELQIQNQKLLRITREMGAQMERGEEETLARRRAEENQAVEEAHELILKLKDEVESGRVRIETIGKERDMLRRMLNQHGGGPGGGAGSANGVGGTSNDIESSRLLAEVQTNFDAYRTEIQIDLNRLKEDLESAQRDANRSRSELAKSKAQAEFLSERFRLLTESYALQSGEVKQMSKRASDLQQNMAKQDSLSHKLTEENHELRSLNNQLRHENTNFKSEREVWKSVESRLVEENGALSKERAHLADLMRNLQTMQNELERSGSEARRRLEEQVVRLDSQNMEIKEKLGQETDASRQLALRKELEAKTYQERLDKLTTEHQETREALIVATTSQEHLQQRVSDLVLQVTAREEKLNVYEGRRTSNGETDPSRSREEQLEISLAELRNELREVKSELERAQAHVEQYKAIAETQGESLRDLNTTYDEYKLSTDGAIAEKQIEITGLRERLHVLTTDLTSASTQNSDLHREIESVRTSFEKERKVLEDEMVHLRAADQLAQERQLSAQEDLRRQAQLAKDAHEKYDRELVAHADDVRRLTEIKEELEIIRATVREHQTSAEVAIANLSTSESSWTRQRVALEQEISDLRKRSIDLDRQNSVLHSQLETFGTQAALLQNRLASVEATDGVGATASSDSVDAITSSLNSTVEQLREVIRYLRQEKEIVDLQLEFSKQEATRLRQQLDFTTRTLDETRQTLTEERQKSGDSTASSAQHAELLERIHTAKLLRESNQTLRDENEANLRKASQLEAQLQNVISELNPLKEKALTLQGELDARQQNIKLLQEDNDRWKVRNQSILAKYERIDPEELQVLKDEVETLRVVKTEIDAVKTQLAQAETAKVEAAEQAAEANRAIETERQARAATQERFRNIQVQARAMREELNELKAKLAAEEGELAEAKAKLAAGEGANVEATNAITEQLRLENDHLAAQLAAANEEKAATQARLRQEAEAQAEKLRVAEFALSESTKTRTTDEEELTRLRKRDAVLFTQNKTFIATNKKLTADLAKAKEEFETANAEQIQAAIDARIALIPSPTEGAVAEAIAQKIAELAAERDAAISSAVSDATSKLQADLVKAQEQIAAASSTASLGGTEGKEELAQTKAELEASKKSFENELEQVKAQLGDEARSREKEITDRLEAELEKVKKDAVASSSVSTSTVDVDSIVQTRLAELDATRAANQQKLIEEAVTAAVDSERAKHEALLAASILKVETQAALKNQLLVKQLNNFKAAKATPGQPASKATPTVSSTATVTQASTSAAPAASPAALPIRPAPEIVAANANTSATRGRGRGVGNVRGRGAAPHRGGRGGGAPSISLRGAAGGGVLGHLLSSAVKDNDKVAGPKRAREEDGKELPTDLAKRIKPGPNSEPQPSNAGGST